MKIANIEEKKVWIDGWLKRRFDKHFAQISTDTSLKARSAVKDVARMMSPDRKVPPEVEKLTHEFMKPPQGIEDRDFILGYKTPEGDWVDGVLDGQDEALIKYTKAYPEQWEVVKKCLGISRQRGRHPCAFVVTEEPISNFIPLTSVGGVQVTQYTAGSVEAVGGLKMDFLVINSLKDIATCLKLIQDRSGIPMDWRRARGPDNIRDLLGQLGADGSFVKEVPAVTINGKKVPLIRVVPWKGQLVDIWDLPERQGPFRDICEGNTTSVFQFGTPGAIKWLRYFNHSKFVDSEGENHKALDSIEALAAFTALDRPGPLDAYVDDGLGNRHNMLVEFARRARGEKAVGNFPILDKLFPETHGILVYQEQLQKAFQQIGKTTGIEANNFRTDVGKKQMKKVLAWRATFMKGAVESVGQEAAEQLWETMVTFGQYGFNKSHSVCYVIIGYACAFLKHYFPLEWWTAVLRNADKSEIDGPFWAMCGHLIDLPDVALSGDDWNIVNERIRAPLNLLKGIGPAAHKELMTLQPLTSIQDLCQKLEDKKINGGVRLPELDKDGKQKIDKKTGLPKFKVKKAKVGLHGGHIKTLIVSGAADSLWPPNTDVTQKLTDYLWINARVTNTLHKKTGVPKEVLEDKYKNLNELALYQMRKQILPSFSENLFPAVSKCDIPGLQVRDGQWKMWYDDEFVPVGLAEAIEFYSNLEPWPRGTVRVAVAAYVQDYKTWKYHGTKEAAKFMVDIQGRRWEVVKWPDKAGKLAAKYKERDLKGAVVLLILSKWDAKKFFSVDDMRVVQLPLGALPDQEVSPQPDEE